LHPSSVISFEETGFIVVNRSYIDSVPDLERYSLTDGSSVKMSDLELTAYKREKEKNDSAEKVISRKAVNYGSDLFATDPKDGIDRQYGRRLVEFVAKNSPDGRTQVVGTYEGKILLMDLEAGFNRGEFRTSPVFAADYRSDGKRAYVADEKQIWEIDATGWPEIEELSVGIRGKDDDPDRERILDMTNSEDGNLIALVSESRLIFYDRQKKKWMKWELPEKLERAAALKIDAAKNKIILVTGKGSIFYGDYVTEKTFFKETKSSIEDYSVAAWIDIDKSMIWAASKPVDSATVTIQKIPLYENSAVVDTIQIAIPRKAKQSKIRRLNNPEIHALARVGDQLAVIYGDSESLQDDHPLLNEQLFVVPINGLGVGKNMTLYEFEDTIDNLGEPHWSIWRIYKISSISNTGQLMVHAELDGIMSVGLDGNMKTIECNLNSRDIILDKDGGYNIAVGSNNASRVDITISHLRRNESFSYSLPWKYDDKPAFASISKDGRKIIVASERGNLLNVDVSTYYIKPTR